MKKAADMLYLLSAISMRSSFITKAAAYARAGYQLFPEDPRLIEVHAYTLMLQGQHDEAEKVLQAAPGDTPNILFLKSRTSLVLQLPKQEQCNRIRRYLSA